MGIPWYTLVFSSPLRLVAFIGFGIFATSSRPGRTSPEASKSTRPRAFADGFGRGSQNILFWNYDEICAVLYSIWLWTYFEKLLSHCFFAFKHTPFDCSILQQIYWGMMPVWLDQAMSGRTILELPSTPCAFKVQATSLQKWTTSLALCEFCYKLLRTLIVEHLVGKPMLHSASTFLIFSKTVLSDSVTVLPNPEVIFRYF